MARGPHPVALDALQMTDIAAEVAPDIAPDIANAAIFYASDGYRPGDKGINGRRVAGESFLRGFLQHGEVDEFVILTKSPPEAAEVGTLIKSVRPDRTLRTVSLVRPQGIAPTQVLYYPAANIATEAWRRADHGSGAWAICGLTHTTSTTGIMQGFFDLRMAPVMEWDAVICTSRAVQGAVMTQMELIDNHIRHRFGAAPPPRPMLPVIPLGIHTADFTRNDAARAALRARLGASETDVVFATIARLSPHEKFDPIPIYLSMQAAARDLPPGIKLHVAICGIFRQPYARKVFQEGAARLMPDVGFLLLDGAKAEERQQTLSGGDVFLFMIDNIQETFGLAPLEGMAAGLPVLASDWDGLRDTITPDVGLRVRSRMLGPQHLANESLRLQGGIDDYPQYCAAVSAMTELDMADMKAKILALACNADLRARLGQGARARVQSHYDWTAVIPQMQALWAEQIARKRAAAAKAFRIRGYSLPIAPSPSLLFAGYPTEVADLPTERLHAPDRPGLPDLTEVLALRNYQGLNRIFAEPAQIAAVLSAVQAGHATLALICTATRLSPMFVERVLMWLLKYDFVRRS
jgi:glycosyltransferase involved in cell wall biosynthesis